MGYAGGGAFVSLLSAFNFFCGMAWFPWVLGWGEEALRPASAEPLAPGTGRRRWRAACLAGAALALQLLSGEPAAAVVSGIALLSLAAAPLLSLGSRGERGRIALRLAALFALALLLAAVQVLPTLGRLPDSPRRGGLTAAASTTWSSPPARLVEIAFPHFFGDPARDQEGLFFGWKIHDGDYPYVPSLYPGLLLAVLGLASLLRGPLPRRSAWILAVAAGLFLALGRHNPLYEGLREAVPVLAVLRYPEKLAVLSVLVLGIAGALAWQRLLDERTAGRREAADLPLALAAVLLATALALTAIPYLLPAVVRGFIRDHGAPGLSPAAREAAFAYLRLEGWKAAATAAAVTGLLALCRWHRPPRRLLAGLAVLLLGVDLWRCAHALVETVPAAIYRDPPPLALLPRPNGGRLFVEPPQGGGPRAVLRRGERGAAVTRAALARLEPYSGVLWQIPYALHEDFDLMLTGWARRSLGVLEDEWSRQPEMAFRFLGVWNVSTVLLRKEPAQWAAELARDPDAPPMRAVANPFLLPRFRFVPRASFHPTWEEAVQSAREQGWLLHRHEHCVRPGAPPGPVTYAGKPPRTLEFADERQTVRLRYAADAPAFFTAAVTFDNGWRATVDGAPVPVWPTAAGQMGMELPAGEHRLVLAYHPPLVGWGAALSLTALAGCGIALVALRRPPPAV
jgi:hypothetical protein